ncbi:MAG: hypothetical protein AAF557_18330, partial [Pseudomonadota bacterium]
TNRRKRNIAVDTLSSSTREVKPKTQHHGTFQEEKPRTSCKRAGNTEWLAAGYSERFVSKRFEGLF